MSSNRGTDLVAGGTQLSNILEVSVADDTWVAVTLGAADLCRSIEAGLRSGAAFKISHLAAGTRYRTVNNTISLNIIKESSKILFYVQTVSGNDTLECILLD